MTDAWREDANCRHADPRIFFDDIWKTERVDQMDADALEVARAYCRICPTRVQCLKVALKAEETTAAKFRAGIFGALTPLQRSSLQKRGWDGAQDPWVYVIGADGHRPIPDAGDDWNERHTRLAARVVAWMVDNTVPGYAMPQPAVLANEMAVRKADMLRVYEALVEDGTIERKTPKAKTRFARTDAPLTANAWSPTHLRSDTVPTPNELAGGFHEPSNVRRTTSP